MTIKEIEERAGMTRANVRFYEAEGLLAPQRLENGYRDYSEEDLSVLLRVRLLRALGTPLDDIRALQRGEQTLDEVLDRRLDGMAAEQAQMEAARMVCLTLRGEGAAFDTLDAARYLDQLENAPAVPATDEVTELRVPWRRFWARFFDGCLYRALGLAVLTLGLRAVTPARGVTFLHGLLLWAVSVVLTVLLEPLLLSRFGATPGKWLLGLRVTDPDGRYLTREAAYTRTVDMLVHGMAFNVPVVRVFCLIRSLVRCEDGRPLAWETDSAVAVRDAGSWRYIPYAVAYAAVLALAALAMLLSWRMPNRGELTAAELSENYARAVQLYGGDTEFRLDPDGTWTKIDGTVGYVGLPSEEMAPPALLIEERDGAVTGVSFEGNVPMLNIRGIEACLVCAFAGAQKDAGLWYGEVRQVMTRLLGWSDDPLQTDVCGVRVESRTEYYDISIPTLTYDDVAGTFATEEFPATRMHVVFSMRLTE